MPFYCFSFLVLRAAMPVSVLFSPRSVCSLAENVGIFVQCSFFIYTNFANSLILWGARCVVALFSDSEGGGGGNCFSRSHRVHLLISTKKKNPRKK